MSKRNLLTESDLQNLEKEVQEQLKISEREVKEAYQESTKLWQQHEESMEKFNAIFNNSELDREAEKELNKIAKEMGVTLEEDNSLKELEAQIDALPDQKTITDKQFYDLPEEVERSQTKVMFDRVSDVSDLLKSHATIAEEALLKSKDEQEITELKSFSKGARKLSESIDKVSNKILEYKDEQVPQKTTHKLISTIGVGLKELYGGLKAGVSKTVDFIKGLGQKMGAAVKSLFSKTPKQQAEQFSGVINDTNKELQKQGNKPNIAAAKQVLKKQFLKLQNDYSKVISSERQAVFNKWKESKNAGIDKMPMKELYAEVQKIRKGILAQKKRNMEAKHGKFTQEVTKQKTSSQTQTAFRR